MNNIIISGISNENAQAEATVLLALENAGIQLTDSLFIEVYYRGLASRGMKRYQISASYMDENEEWSTSVADINHDEMTLNDNSDEADVEKACRLFTESMVDDYIADIIAFVAKQNDAEQLQ